MGTNEGVKLSRTEVNYIGMSEIRWHIETAKDLLFSSLWTDTTTLSEDLKLTASEALTDLVSAGDSLRAIVETLQKLILEERK